MHSTTADSPRAGNLPIVVVVGPTGAGKSDLALQLAERTGAEVVSADSQQVYRGMDIGTGKVTRADRERVPHHLLDIADPDEQMTAARFCQLADAAIEGIAGRGRPVVVAGGTGLYVRALLYGLFEGPPADPALRERLAAEAAAAGGPRVLWERLRAIDPDSAARIHDTDLIRITRALEVHALTGVTMTEHHRRHDHATVPMRYRARLVGLAPDHELLYRRIDARVDAMLEAGLIAEVEGLRAAGYRPPLRSQAAIGYAEVHSYLDGDIDLTETIRLIKRNSRRYARRQRSWYRSDPKVEWYAAPSEVDQDELGSYLGGAW